MAKYNRRNFIKSLAAAGIGSSFIGGFSAFAKESKVRKNTSKIGIIGLDTSHAVHFTRFVNVEDEGTDFKDFDIVAAYPYGSRKIPSSYERIPGYIEDVSEMGVDVVDSIEELLDMVDYVLLLTNDGNPRYEQALQVMEAGKTMFVDKPVAASLKDTIAIMDASREYDVPIFSSSGLRYVETTQSVRNDNKVGKVLGADAFTPSIREETHPDLFWYGIHGVETLFTVLKTGCKHVTRKSSEHTDIVVGTWEDEVLGVLRGTREGSRGYGGTAYGTDDILVLGGFTGYHGLVKHFIDFFKTGNPPVSLEETLEIYAFMEAADESKRRGGDAVTLEEVIDKARS
ncbi:Gfo/Idh/MocA family protein [Natronogracilivirga saccharolytica]|uniref:Gfo/Idh/MocA family oxidoreductase n=1 Tax=Natronogracilivirga saccharolytica TaxID=2812953 RepID=A0A8J7SBE3_9BACT|nr:Gfo/Idh/MocA family oxidoreductase [Natronogracilivirga saccharolytica]MBP3193973.1 Gfo/Idh/MocA family oxidoreductase [Natronogracilivirga saccharolytica]